MANAKKTNKTNKVVKQPKAGVPPIQKESGTGDRVEDQELAIVAMMDKGEILDEPKETTDKRTRIAKDVFDKHSQCKVLYFTSDLIPFFAESDAIKHGAGKLKNDTIVTINRK